MPRLPYLDAVINEVLRLYPAAYVLQRTSVEPFDLAAYQFPVNTTVIMSQWIVHRDPRYFDAPDEFQPERWLDGLESRLHRLRLFSVRRRSAAMHRADIRVDGSGVGRGDAGAKIPLRRTRRNESRARAAGDVARKRRRADDRSNSRA